MLFSLTSTYSFNHKYALSVLRNGRRTGADRPGRGFPRDGSIVGWEPQAKSDTTTTPGTTYSFSAKSFLVTSATMSERDPLIQRTRSQANNGEILSKLVRSRRVGPFEVSRTTRYGILAGIWSANFLAVPHIFSSLIYPAAKGLLRLQALNRTVPSFYGVDV
jgi:hypothetical protein